MLISCASALLTLPVLMLKDSSSLVPKNYEYQSILKSVLSVSEQQ